MDQPLLLLGLPGKPRQAASHRDLAVHRCVLAVSPIPGGSANGGTPLITNFWGRKGPLL